jgi:hypothetical protein
MYQKLVFDRIMVLMPGFHTMILKLAKDQEVFNAFVNDVRLVLAYCKRCHSFFSR